VRGQNSGHSTGFNVRWGQYKAVGSISSTVKVIIKKIGGRIYYLLHER
jgi:hypothetical protein